MKKQRVAIVKGLRTPFVKAGTKYSRLTLQELGVHTLKALVEKSGLDVCEVDSCIFSTVLLDPRTPNWAREMVMAADFPKSIYAWSVSNNCISGLVAVTAAAQEITLGRAEVILAGGSESMSRPSLLYHEDGADIFLQVSRLKSVSDKLKVLAGLRPKHFLPTLPSVTEPSTGLTMGEHMEITAKEMGIGREQQDEIAFASHENATQAFKNGVYQDELVPLAGVEKDLLVRDGTTLEKLAKLRPVFDRSEKGTLTAGNSSALTDGGSAVVLMSEEKAKSLGLEILAFIADYEYAAIAPNDGLLMAPAVAVPRLLKRHKLNFSDFDMLEVHEAFAAQVLANIKAWEEGWREDAVGKFDRSKLNMFGGSIALGHPFAATGGRMITTMANQLQQNSWKRGLISICAAGAMAGAMILERD